MIVLATSLCRIKKPRIMKGVIENGYCGEFTLGVQLPRKWRRPAPRGDDSSKEIP